MEIIDQYPHIGLGPAEHDLEGNWSGWLFAQCIWDLLHEWSFTKLDIVTDPDLNAVHFEASERRRFHPVREDCWSFLIISEISYWTRPFTKYIAKYKDGSFRRGLTREEAAGDTIQSDTDLESLSLGFILPKEWPVDEIFVQKKVHEYSRIFHFSKINCNHNEEKGEPDENRITSFLKRETPSGSAQFYEFRSDDVNFSWEVSFTFDYAEKRIVSFINGIETPRGGTHVDCVVRAIESALRETGILQDIPFDNMSLAVSLHLLPERSPAFDEERPDPKPKLISEHPEFRYMENDLKERILRRFSEDPSCFLKFGPRRDSARIFEFSSDDEDVSWMVSFTFDHAPKRVIFFINGIKTPRGGTHVDCVVQAIEQALRESKKFQNRSLDDMSLALSIHLPQDAGRIFDESPYDSNTKPKLLSEHPEFQIVSKELKFQITSFFSVRRKIEEIKMKQKTLMEE